MKNAIRAFADIHSLRPSWINDNILRLESDILPHTGYDQNSIPVFEGDAITLRSISIPHLILSKLIAILDRPAGSDFQDIELLVHHKIAIKQDIRDAIKLSEEKQYYMSVKERKTFRTIVKTVQAQFDLDME